MSEKEQPKQPQISCEADEGFMGWMSRYGGSLILSAPASGRIVVLGWDGRQVTVLSRQMDMPTGIAVQKEQVIVATRRELTLYSNARLLAYDYDTENQGAYDGCFLPRATWYVGEVSPRSVGFCKDGITFVSTRFSCLAQPSFLYHFQSIWQPPFVNKLEPTDFCHVSGMALSDGQPVFATAYSESSEPDGWRRNRQKTGVLVDISKNQVVVNGLCMPHSPRWYRGCPWFLNSGTGELWVMNPRSSETTALPVLPGFARGLDFWENYAIIGLSKVRKNQENGVLPVERMNHETICAVAVIDVLSGKLVGTFRFTAGCDEIYEVCTLPGIRRAAWLTADKPRCHEALTTEGTSWWIRQDG